MNKIGDILKAKTFYESLGYVSADVHWIVPDFISNITKPEGVDNFYTKDGLVLTASAEQGFLYSLYLHEHPAHPLHKFTDVTMILPGVHYMAVTPCVRDEKVTDIHHRHSFYKVELFYYNNDVPESVLHSMINDALMFFKYNWSDENSIDLIKLSDTEYDINGNGVEIGSYSIREHTFENGRRIKWCCGTGYAIERTNIVLK